MYIWTMRRSCQAVVNEGCVDDANFRTRDEYCTEDLCNNQVCIGGSRGRRRRPPPPPTGSISFVFAYVFTKKCTHRRLAPPPPPNGKSWIRHWYVMSIFIDLKYAMTYCSVTSSLFRKRCYLEVKGVISKVNVIVNVPLSAQDKSVLEDVPIPNDDDRCGAISLRMAPILPFAMFLCVINYV